MPKKVRKLLIIGATTATIVLVSWLIEGVIEKWFPHLNPNNSIAVQVCLGLLGLVAVLVVLSLFILILGLMSSLLIDIILSIDKWAAKRGN